MNVPFPPLFLWPVVVGMVVGAILWRRWQRRAFLAAPAEDWPKHAPRGWKNARFLPWFLAIAGAIGAYSLWRFSAPCVYGRIVDAATGKPIPNALVMRRIHRRGPPSLAESGITVAEPFSSWKTHAGQSGRFFLPGWVSLFPFGISGTSGMTWVVYHPGWMPGRECISKGFTGPGGCGGEGGFITPEPWVLAKTEHHFGLTRLELRVYPPTLEGVTFRAHTGTGEVVRIDTPPDADPWGEYFRRLNVLVQYRNLRVEEFAKEATAYVERGLPLSDRIASQFLELVGAPIMERPISRDHDRKVLLLRKAILDYCNQTPTSAFCRRCAVGIGYIREFFQNEKPGAR
jgi:hypothetical protein